MIPCDAEGVSRRQRGHVRGRFSVGEHILGTRQRRFQQTFIPNPRLPAVFGNLSLVDG